MKKLFIVCMMCVPLVARELTTPLPFDIQFRNPVCLSNGRMPTQWTFDFWTGGYQRGTSKAFCADSCISCCPLSTLFFNESDFTAKQTFAEQTASSIISPFLNSTLSPRIKFIDRGVVCGMSAIHKINKQWYLGVRAKLPYRKFKVCALPPGGGGSSELGGLSADDVFINKTETFSGNDVETFAYRLDFLSKLPVDCKAPGINFLIVDYHDTSFPTLPITISNQDVTDNPALAVNDRNPVTVIRKNNGEPPTPPCALPVATAQGLPAISSNGSSITDGQRGRFIDGTNYTDLGDAVATQKQMWIVPSVDTSAGQLVPPAQIIKDHVDQILGCIDTSAEDLFARCGDISFASQETKGAGDFDIEFFFQHYYSKKVFLEGFFGITLPTGVQVSCPNLIYQQPLGNNGHYEVKGGVHLWYHPIDWFVFNGDALYSAVVQSTEKVAGSFSGAAIKNIGPTVFARISWRYFLSHLTAQFCMPFREDHEFNYTLSYEFYHKQKDRICFCEQEAVDCLGDVQALNSCVLESNTTQTSNKIIGEISYCYVGNDAIDFSIFAGFNRVIAGRNVPKEHGWQAGMSITFFIV